MRRGNRSSTTLGSIHQFVKRARRLAPQSVSGSTRARNNSAINPESCDEATQRGNARLLWKDSAWTAVGREVAGIKTDDWAAMSLLFGVTFWRSRRRILLSE